MSSTRAWRPTVAFALLCASGCLGSYSRAVDETRRGLLGLEGRDLRACLGVPSEFAIDGDVEQQSYRFDHDDEFDEVGEAGGIGGVVIGSRGPDDRGHDGHRFALDRPDASYCQLDFELTRGRVTRVSAQGRSREGMNIDSSCLLRARRCLPYSDEEAIDASE